MRSVRETAPMTQESDFQTMTQSHPHRYAKINNKNLTVLLASLAYACFVVFFPWEEIRHDDFRDFDRYVDFFNSQAPPTTEWYGIDSMIVYFHAEQLWIDLISWLTAKTGEAAIALRVISFLICVVWGTFLFSRMPIGWALPFLLNPTSIDMAMSQIRQGFAWSLVIIGLMASSLTIRGLLFVSASFFHTTSVGLVALYLSAKMSVAMVHSTRALILWLIILK